MRDMAHMVMEEGSSDRVTFATINELCMVNNIAR